MSRSPLRRLLAAASLLAGLGLTSCAAAPPFDAAAMVKEWSEFMQRDYVLRPGDQLAISVYEQDDLTQEPVVAPDGSIALRRIDRPIRVGGVSVAGAQELVEQVYADVLVAPEVSLSLVEVSASSVYVGGEVLKPSAVAWVKGMTVTQAITEAGGYKLTAKSTDVLVIRNTGSEGARTYRINVWDTLHNEAPDFLVLPGDVVFAQTSTIADVGDWIQLHIARLIPIPPSSLIVF